jgi:hypothetical protein
MVKQDYLLGKVSFSLKEVTHTAMEDGSQKLGPKKEVFYVD